MEINDVVSLTIKGVVVKKEMYKDGIVRCSVQNVETNEFAVVKDEEVKSNVITK